MTAALRQYLKDGEYTGPVCFKDGLVFRWLSCLTILLYLGLSRLAERAGGLNLSLFSYIMQGGWMRGINLFGICASAIVLITGFVLLTLCGGAVSLLCRVLDSKGETICRLVYNLIQYLTFCCPDSPVHMVVAADQHNRLTGIDHLRGIPEVFFGAVRPVFQDHPVLRDSAFEKDIVHDVGFRTA